MAVQYSDPRLVPFRQGARRGPARLRPGALRLGAGVLTALAAMAFINHRLARKAERDNPPVGRFVEVNGIRLHVLERGAGTPLVLLHGNGSLIQDFLASGLVDRAAERYRVIVFDRPGYGYSERPRHRIWTAEAQADHIALALRQLNAERAIVLGHSWGCLVAVALAQRHSDLVGGLVLEAGYFYPSVRLDVWPLAVPAVPVVGDILRHTLSPFLGRALWPRFMRRIFGPNAMPRTFEDFPREMALRPSQLRASAEESALMIPGALAARRHYGDLALPVAIVTGAEDRMVSAEDQSARLHDDIHQSTLRRVPATGHMVHHTATQAVLDAVERVRLGAVAASPGEGPQPLPARPAPHRPGQRLRSP